MSEELKPAESLSDASKLAGVDLTLGETVLVGMRGTHALTNVYRKTGDIVPYEPRVWDAR